MQPQEAAAPEEKKDARSSPNSSFVVTKVGSNAKENEDDGQGEPGAGVEAPADRDDTPTREVGTKAILSKVKSVSASPLH